jgi:5'(3')-deoxyribonucleotidase
MSKTNIALDVDGVLRNIISSSIRAYILNGGHKQLRYADVKNYDFKEQFEIKDFENFF